MRESDVVNRPRTAASVRRLGLLLITAAFAVNCRADSGIALKASHGDGPEKGSFSAKAHPKYDPQDLANVREIKLSGGIRGFFRPVSCGGSCAPANLWWEQGGVLYQIQLDLSSDLSESNQEKAMADAADSAISAGPR